MKLMVTCQYVENYRTAANPSWKAKGDETYCVGRVSYTEAAQLGSQGLRSRVLALVADHELEYRNEYAQQYMIDWSLEEDDYITPDEQIQMDCYGKIESPHRDFTQDFRRAA